MESGRTGGKDHDPGAEHGKHWTCQVKGGQDNEDLDWLKKLNQEPRKIGGKLPQKKLKKKEVS